MTKQEEIRERIEDCILPWPTTKTWVTRNIAQQISEDIVDYLRSQGVELNNGIYRLRGK